MINAKAAIEQMRSGQIGQPAACMIENKRETPPSVAPVACFQGADYGAGIELRRACATRCRRLRQAVTMRSQSSTAAVDNFVDKCRRWPVNASPSNGSHFGAEKSGMKNLLCFNGLRRHDAAFQAEVAGAASFDAAVELSRPAVQGDAGD